MGTLESAKSSNASEEKKPVEPLPDNPWGLLAYVVKAFGANAPLILVAAGVVAAFVMLQRERNAADELVAEKTKEANERLAETYQRIADASTGQVDGLSKVMNLSKTLTSTIAEQVTEVQRMNTEAEKLRKDAGGLRDEMMQLQDERDTLQHVGNETRAWGNLFRLSLLAGELAAAPTKRDAEDILKQIEDVQSATDDGGDTSGSAATVRQATAGLRDAIVHWDDNPSVPQPPTTVSDAAASKIIPQETTTGQANVQQACLALARASRASFDEAPQPLQDLIAGVRQILYDQAVSVAYRLATATDWSQATADRNEFKSLYWGKLVFVENKEVEVVMVYYRRALDEWEKQAAQGAVDPNLRDGRVELANELRKACDSPSYKAGVLQGVNKESGA